MINTSFIYDYGPLLLSGALVTIEIAAIGTLIGLILGTLLGFMQAHTKGFLFYIITGYIIIIRGTPMLLQITFAVFVLPQFGVYLSDFWAATLAIGINSAAYVSQIIKGGIQSVNIGEIEAAKTLGFSTLQINRFIILPQAIRSVLPSLGNELITLIKDSSLASTVGVVELSKQAWFIRSRTFDALSVYLIVAVMYLCMTTLLSLLILLLEKKVQRHAQS
ncbi:MAG: amino acid ABC transporter permease [Candidatus Babeliales bacterium]